ncbi:hypothetical protein [Luteolibacter marinus]|uniref:hypothetical protein n=1 Tax=Luteolibacter marinus TaxID=2776705 RepID=UPI00186760C7|nr:hypothetical protein [Luteolibacter marinus]
MKTQLSLDPAIPAAAFLLLLSGAASAETIFSSGFNGHTGSVTLGGNTDNTSGSASLNLTDWSNHPSVTSLSALTAISTGDSGTSGGFAQLQGGTAAFAGPNNLYLSRNHNLDTLRTTSKRGFSLTFTLDETWSLTTLTLVSGHTTNTGNQDQALVSTLVCSLSGGTLPAPVSVESVQDYGAAPAYHTVPLDLSGTSLDAGTYTLEVYQTNMTGGGAYAIYDGITLAGALDEDQDGLADDWEILHFGSIGAQDGTGDLLLDNDGLTNAEEAARGTDPNKADTDDDGLNDRVETDTGVFVSATDTGTDPLDDDSDDDGLEDGVETFTGTFVSAADTGTDPLYHDSDGDTLIDGWEVRYGLDPTSTASPDGEYDDPDNDFVENWEEQQEGTDPTLLDTDGDGLDDGLELGTTTDPLNPDSDGDGLKDGEEDANEDGFVDFDETDPMNPDSDGDLYADGAEATDGSDPLEPSSVPSYSILTSNFDGNTGAVVLGGVTDNTSGATSLGVTWTKDAAVGTVSDLSAVSTGDSGTLGGFAQLQGGTAPYANADNLYLSRNHNLDSDRTTSKRGFSLDFEINNPVDAGLLTIRSGHTNNSALQDQAYTSNLVFILEGGTLAQPLSSVRSVDYNTGPAYFDIKFSLAGTTLGTGTYTLTVYQTRMYEGGAYAIFDGLRLDTAAIAPAPILVTGSGFNGAAFEMTVTGLDPSKRYLLKRSADLTDGYPARIGPPVAPADITATFTDPSPAGGRAFYRVEEAP